MRMCLHRLCVVFFGSDGQICIRMSWSISQKFYERVWYFCIYLCDCDCVLLLLLFLVIMSSGDATMQSALSLNCITANAGFHTYSIRWQKFTIYGCECVVLWLCSGCACVCVQCIHSTQWWYIIKIEAYVSSICDERCVKTADDQHSLTHSHTRTRRKF